MIIAFRFVDNNKLSDSPSKAVKLGANETLTKPENYNFHFDLTAPCLSTGLHSVSRFLKTFCPEIKSILAAHSTVDQRGSDGLSFLRNVATF